MKRLFLLLSALFAGLLSGCQAASIGVIGGSDGPTAIFVSSDPKLNAAVIPALIIILAVIIVVAFFVRHKK